MIRKINNRSNTYNAVQGVLGTFGLTFGALFVGGSVDYYMLKSEADLSAFGAELYPTLLSFSGIGLAVVVGLMAWGYVVHNKFWVKIEIAETLRRVASKIDPRRGN